MSVKRLLAYLSLLTLLFALLPYSCWAQGWQWARSTAGTQMSGVAVSTDDSGDIFVGGLNQMIPYAPATGTVEFGSGVSVVSTTPIGPAPRLQSIWAKYDKNGNILWADGTEDGDTHFYSCTPDPNGNLIVFGSFKSPTVKIGPFVLVNSLAAGNSQYFLAKVSPTGSVLWAIKDGNVYWNVFSWISMYLGRNGSVATDAAGNIYITTSFNSPTMSVGPTVLVNALSGKSDVFVAKYDPNGNPLWARSIGGTRDEFSYDIEVASTGDVYVTGSFTSLNFPVGPSLLTYTAIPVSPVTPYPLAYIARFSSAGMPLWAEKGASLTTSIGLGLAADNSGNMYMCGVFYPDTIQFGALPIINSVLGNAGNSAYVVKFSPANTAIWGTTMWSPVSHAHSYDIAYNAKCDEVWTVGGVDSGLHAGGYLIPPQVGDENGPWRAFMAGFRGDGSFIEAIGITDGARDMIAVNCDKKGNTFACADYRIIYGSFERFALGPDTLIGNGPSDHHNDFLYLAKYKRHRDRFLASHDTAICALDSIVLDPGHTYEYYMWSDSATTPTKKVYSGGKYWVSSWDDCEALIITDTFNVRVIDGINTSSLKDTAVCVKDNVELHASAGYSDYVWYNDSIGDSYVAHDTGIFWVRSRRNCERHTDSFSIKLKDYPFKMAEPDSMCVGLPVRLRLATLPPDSAVWVHWQPTAGITDTSLVNTAVIINIPGTYTYSVTLESAEGCRGTDSVKVRILPPISIEVTPEEATIEYGGKVQLQALPADMSRTDLFFTWEPSDGSISNPNINNPIATPTTTTTYTVYAVEPNGCRDTANLVIFVDYLRECLPSAFTPNGDGLNDVFRLCSLHGQKLLDFSIYNRYGERVYHNTLDPKGGWDGNYKGLKADMGVYFYMILLAEPDGDQKVLKGDVTLIR